MIRTFKDEDTRSLFERQRVKRFEQFERVALRKLTMLDAAVELRDLQSPPGNRLEALKGNRGGQHSIRINDQWRVCFRWSDEGHAEEVEICDYH
jgi:proteic killer suppression protein